MELTDRKEKDKESIVKIKCMAIRKYERSILSIKTCLQNRYHNLTCHLLAVIAPSSLGYFSTAFNRYEPSARREFNKSQ